MAALLSRQTGGDPVAISQNRGDVDSSMLTAAICQCTDESCPCKGRCQLPPTKYIKFATFEALCTACAEYALLSYDGAREAQPFDERWARFDKKHVLDSSSEAFRFPNILADVVPLRDEARPYKWLPLRNATTARFFETSKTLIRT